MHNFKDYRIVTVERELASQQAEKLQEHSSFVLDQQKNMSETHLLHTDEFRHTLSKSTWHTLLFVIP